MKRTQRDRWEGRYATGQYVPRSDPSPFLVDWLDRLPRGKALDIACGTGRNALLLAAAGFDVEAVDISATAIDRARTEAAQRKLEAVFNVADVDAMKIADHRYDLVTVFRYTNRSLWPRLVKAVRPGGAIVVEHHLDVGRPVAGPSDPAFRLAPGELLAAFAELRIVLYSETVEPADRGDGVYALARMVAFAGEPGIMT